MAEYGYKKLSVWQKDNPEEARAAKVEAGKASGRTRRKKKILKELLEIALSQPAEDCPGDNYMAITVSLIQKAKEGDVKAYHEIRDALGQAIEQVELKSDTIKINITGEDDE